MTPKEKGVYLVGKFYKYQPLLSVNECKVFALIVVDEMIKESKTKNIYWLEVRKEILAYTKHYR